MTLATIPTAEVEVFGPPTTTLQLWAEDARQAVTVAQSLAKTPFVPASLVVRGDLQATVGNITAAILTGQELGLQPMAALRAMDVIQGTPALRAITLRALVQAHGHEVWVDEATETRAIVRGKRKGSENVQTSTWTLDRARGLALVGKDNWRKQPGAMLVARATSELCRLIAADVIMAMPYSVEELQDGDEAETVVESATADTKRTAQRRTKPAPAPARPPVPAEVVAQLPEPSFDEPTSESETEAILADPETRAAISDGLSEFLPPEPEDLLTSALGAEPITDEQPDEPLATDAQVRALNIMLGKLGFKTDEERHANLSAHTGRTITSSKLVTKREASSVIDKLQASLS